MIDERLSLPMRCGAWVMASEVPLGVAVQPAFYPCFVMCRVLMCMRLVLG